MNFWQFHCRIGKGWLPCGPFSFFLFTLDNASEHSHSHTGLVLLADIFTVTVFCLLFLSVWSNSNVSVIHLTVRIVLGNHNVERLKGWTLKSWIIGDPKLEGNLIWKRGSQTPAHIMDPLTASHHLVWCDAYCKWRCSLFNYSRYLMWLRVQRIRVEWLYGRKPLTVSHRLSMFSACWSSAGGDIAYFICHVTLQDQGRSPSR